MTAARIKTTPDGRSRRETLPRKLLFYGNLMEFL